MQDGITAVAVTGASGFLGRQVVRQLLAEGCQVVALVRDAHAARAVLPPQVDVRAYRLQEVASVRAVIADCQVVVHGAAVHNRKLSERAEVMAVNVQGTENVVAALAAHQKLVYISSIRSMMTTRESLVDEHTPYDFAPYDSPYGYSKYAAEQVCLASAKTGQAVYLLNPAVIIGPEDSGPSHNGAMIRNHLRASLVPYAHAVLSLVDVRDVARAVSFVLEKGRPGERHIVCSAQYALREFYRRIDQASGQRKHYVPVPYAALWLAGLLAEWREKIQPAFEPPITRSGALAVKLGIGFSGAKLAAMGFAYTDPQTTIRDATAWFLQSR